jgi:hypothetical protein
MDSLGLPNLSAHSWPKAVEVYSRPIADIATIYSFASGKIGERVTRERTCDVYTAKDVGKLYFIGCDLRDVVCEICFSITSPECSSRSADW